MLDILNHVLSLEPFSEIDCLCSYFFISDYVIFSVQLLMAAYVCIYECLNISCHFPKNISLLISKGLYALKSY